MSLFRSKRHLLVLAIFLLLGLSSLVYLYQPLSEDPSPAIFTAPPLVIVSTPNIKSKPLSEYTRTLVMGRLKADDISWLDSDLPTLNRAIYTVDDPTASPSIPRNKGHEAMVYLTYIIDHYDVLPDTVLFFHPHRQSWHNNVLLDIDTATTISRLSDARVAREGYFNSRCHLDPGCPDWLHLDRPEKEWDLIRKVEEPHFTSAVWRELHPGAPLPRAISQPCCAQFAVSRDRIRSRPHSEYVRWRDWLLNTKLEDSISGRIMEYTWQYIFTGQSEWCPPMHECYCDGYGICFGGAEQMQNWLWLLRRRELIEADIWTLTSKPEDNAAEMKELQVSREAVDAALVRLKVEAYKRGEDPKNRALEAGRAWEEGDGF